MNELPPKDSTTNVNVLSPKDMMKVRHPDLFSDTQIDSGSIVPRDLFEYHLDTLTSRKQENQFEHFCRRLVEKEICPNIRGQTGPTGGGDSKVDSETYPVANEITERWWIGSPSAGTERWAFAFSAKKRWKPKVISDVDKILGTHRNYNRIFFITNQFVSDKNRANSEDELHKKAGIPVHIFDRTWIVEAVYKSDQSEFESYLAALGIDTERRKTTSDIGPRDTSRLRELEVLDKQISDTSRYRTARYQLVEDCLRCAILARSLERPRSEVEDRFKLAHRLSLEVGFNQQQLKIAYNRAWTAFWWYEDYIDFNNHYSKVEELVERTDLVVDVDLLFNLWMLLLPLSSNNQIKNIELNVEERTERLYGMLDVLAADTTRPTNALQAKTSLILLRTTLAFKRGNTDKVEKGWFELSELIDEVNSFTAYSVEHLYGLVRELGVYVDGTEFDKLYDKLTSLIRVRRSDGEAGQAYFQRAEQKLAQGKPYQAIEWYGRSEEMLTKKEYQKELIHTLLGESRAYESVDLHWAARIKALAAADISMSILIDEGHIIPEILSALNYIAWIELKLGRIPQILDTMTRAGFFASQLNLSTDQEHVYGEHLSNQDVVLGIHMLNVPFESLKAVSNLPSVLDRLGFSKARLALLYTLGHEQTILDEEPLFDSKHIPNLNDFFSQWKNQPIADQVNSQPVLADKDVVLLKSTILGSVIAVETPNNRTSIGLVETLLSAMESLLSTSNELNAFPYRENLSVKITVSEQYGETPHVDFHESGDYQVEVLHSSSLTIQTIDDRKLYSGWLRETIFGILTQILHFPNIKEWAERVINRERGLFRSITLVDSLTMNSNVFGDHNAMRLAEWFCDEDLSYEVLRDRHWFKPKSVNDENSIDTIEFGEDEPSSDLYDHERLKHTDRRILSPIDVQLWDRAKWKGTLFISYQGKPPVLGIMFENGEAGQAIFRKWFDRWGRIDVDNDLRVSIVRGVTTKNPAEYAVIIGPNLQRVQSTDKKIVMGISRILRMTPDSTASLEWFVSEYDKIGKYILIPAQLDMRSLSPVFLPDSIEIEKSEIVIRDAWQIGFNDPDITVFHKDDKPIIPSGIVDPPITKALARRWFNCRS